MHYCIIYSPLTLKSSLRIQRNLRYLEQCGIIRNTENKFFKQKEIPRLKIHLCWSESQTDAEIDIDVRWIHREINSMFTLSSDKDKRKKFVFTFA